STVMWNSVRKRPPALSWPTTRTRWPVVVLYWLSTTAPGCAADCVSTYACEPLLLRTTRNTPVGTCSTFVACRISGPDGESVGKRYAFVSPIGPAGSPATKPSLEPSSVSDRLPTTHGWMPVFGPVHVVVCRVARLITPASCVGVHPETLNASAFPSALLASSITCPVTCGTRSGVSPLGWPWPSMLNRNRCEGQTPWPKAVMAAATNVRSPPSLLTATKS